MACCAAGSNSSPKPAKSLHCHSFYLVILRPRFFGPNRRGPDAELENLQLVPRPFVFTTSLLRVEGMLALLVELILNFEAGVIGLYRADGFHNRGNPSLHVPFAEFFRSHRAIA